MIKEKTKLLFFSTILSVFFLCYLYPDYFFYSNVRFTSGHDISQPFYSAFIVSNNIYNYDFDNFNIFDQVNHSYHHLTAGLYTFPALVESLIFFLIKGFGSDLAQLFHLVHLYTYQILCILFRSFGAILILNLYRLNFYEKIFFILILNTLYSISTIAGIMTGFIYSLVPIAIYFIIKIYRENNLKDILFLYLFLAFIFAQAPLMVISYLYLPLHFCLIYLIVDKIKTKNFIKYKLNLNLLIIFFISLILSSYIIFFNFQFYNILNETFSIYEISENKNRLQNLFNYRGYFDYDTPDHLSFDFFSNLINYKVNNFNRSGNFLGIISLTLFLIGTFKSKNNEKWIFFTTVIIIFLLMGSRKENFLSPTYYAHLLNFLTNPFASFIRDPHMSYLFIQYLIFPNVVMGYISLRDSNDFFKFKANIDFYILLIFILFLIFFSNLIIIEIYKYIAFFFIIISLIFIYNKNKKIVSYCLFALLLTDIFLLKPYLNYIPYVKEKIFKRQFKESNKHYLLDIQNPLTKNLPLYLIEKKPIIKKRKISKDEKYIHNEFLDNYFNDQTYYGFFWNNIFSYRLDSNEKIYELRHKSFKKYEKIDEDNQLFNFYDKNNKKILNTFIKISKDINLKDIFLYKSNKDFDIYYFNTSKIISNYINTNIFDRANGPSLIINDSKLDPVQNNITMKNEFDFNNFKEDFVYFSLGKNKKIKTIKLSYFKHRYIEKINIKKSKYNFTFTTPEETILIIKFPYDNNWKFFINTKTKKNFSHDKKWIRLNLPKGKNILTMKYDLREYFINNVSIIFYFLFQLVIVLIILLKLLTDRNKQY